MLSAAECSMAPCSRTSRPACSAPARHPALAPCAAPTRAASRCGSCSAAARRAPWPSSSGWPCRLPGSCACCWTGPARPPRSPWPTGSSWKTSASPSISRPGTVSCAPPSSWASASRAGSSCCRCGAGCCSGGQGLALPRCWLLSLKTQKRKEQPHAHDPSPPGSPLPAGRAALLWPRPAPVGAPAALQQRSPHLRCAAGGGARGERNPARRWRRLAGLGRRVCALQRRPPAAAAAVPARQWQHARRPGRHLRASSVPAAVHRRGALALLVHQATAHLFSSVCSTSAAQTRICLPRHLQDAGEFWEATPPARQQLLDALLGGEGGGPDLSLRCAAGNAPAGADAPAVWPSSIAISMPAHRFPPSPQPLALAHSLSWSVQRDLPLASERGGPLCWPGISVPLAPASRRQLAALLRGEASEAQLLRDDDGAGGEAGSAALHPLVWLLRGDLCSSSPLQLRDVPSDAADPIWSAWMACNASLLPSNEPARQAMLQPGASLSSGGSMAQQRRLAATAAQGHVGSSTADWWRLGCWPVNASGDPLLPPAEAQATAECGSGYTGPRWGAGWRLWWVCGVRAGRPADAELCRSAFPPTPCVCLLQARGCARARAGWHPGSHAVPIRCRWPV